MPYVVYLHLKAHTWELTRWDGEDSLELDADDFTSGVTVSIEPLFIEEDE